MVVQDEDNDRMPNFDGSVLTGDAYEEDVLRKKSGNVFWSLGVENCRPSGFL